MLAMNGLIKWFEDAPLWLKIIFALPGVDLVWGIFRIVKGAVKKDVKLLVIGILWVVLGFALLWIVDIVTIIIKKHPIWA